MNKKMCKIKKDSFIWFILIILLILFIAIWGKVIGNNIQDKKTLTNMVEGKDYYIEELTITKKDIYYGPDTSETGPSNNSYYFCHTITCLDKIFVSQSTYAKYQVGDKILAYTLNHEKYVISKNELLLKRNNELLKVVGVIIGIIIFIITFIKTIYPLLIKRLEK